MKQEKLILIDAMGLIYKTFFAFSDADLKTSQGFPTGALYGVVLFINKLLSEQKPTHVALCLDSPGESYRKEIYPEYKSNRERMPGLLSSQLPAIFEFFDLLDISKIEFKGFEADDVIGSLVCQLKSQLPICIISDDKDYLQLIEPGITQYSRGYRGQVRIWDEELIEEKYGIRSEQIVDYLSLIGDQADFVAGVPGIGPKSAVTLLKDYGSVEAVFENLAKIPAKFQKKLSGHLETVALAKKLITLQTDLLVKVKIEDFLYREPNTSGLYEFFQQYEFHSLIKKLPHIPIQHQEEPLNILKTHDVALWADAKQIYVLADKNELLLFEPTDKKVYSFDLEVELERESIKSLLGRTAVVTHGGKDLLHTLSQFSICSKIKVDLKIADYLLFPHLGDHSLRKCLLRMLKVDHEHRGLQIQKILELWKLYQTELKQNSLVAVFEDIEMPLLAVLHSMEQAGVFLDVDFVEKYKKEIQARLVGFEKNVYHYAGCEFNLNSTKQLREILYDKMALQDKWKVSLKKTKTGFSTDEETLMKLSKEPIVGEILKYRQLYKLISTYLEPLPKHVNEKTRRIHPHFRQTVAVTGRLSCENPNLQNIPYRRPEGQKLREAFSVSDKNSWLVSADYSQIEIRLLAHLAQSSTLIEAFLGGLDIHLATAMKMFDLPKDNVSRQMRNQAKAINFGILYGMGAHRLSQELEISYSQAESFIQQYFAKYPEIKAFTEGLVELARDKGYTETLFGRKRPLPEIYDQNKMIQARARNIAVNAPIQGTAADIIKLSMLSIHQKFHEQRLSSRMILQIHDELVFEVVESELEQVKSIVRTEMEGVCNLKVPLLVDLNVGENWLEAH